MLHLPCSFPELFHIDLEIQLYQKHSLSSHLQHHIDIHMVEGVDPLPLVFCKVQELVHRLVVHQERAKGLQKHSQRGKSAITYKVERKRILIKLAFAKLRGLKSGI